MAIDHAVAEYISFSTEHSNDSYPAHINILKAAMDKLTYVSPTLVEVFMRLRKAMSIEQQTHK